MGREGGGGGRFIQRFRSWSWQKKRIRSEEAKVDSDLGPGSGFGVRKSKRISRLPSPISHLPSPISHVPSPISHLSWPPAVARDR